MTSARVVWVLCLLSVSGVLAQPVNDTCLDALTVGDGSTAFSTIDATNNGPLHASCPFDPEVYNDIWFEYTATCTGNLTVSTCGTVDYDSSLVIYDGCDCGTLAADFLGCNEDGTNCPGFNAELTAGVSQGSCYLVRLGGFSAADEGSGTVDLSCQEFGKAACCLPDDDCVVTTMEDCATQAGEFHPGSLTCAAGVCSLSAGPDVVYTDCDSVNNWGSVGGIRGYSLESQTCNLGDADLSWTSTGPLLAMNAYQLRDGRLTQIGMSWVKNATLAIAGNGCAPTCQGGGGSTLGVGCQDIYSAQFNGGHFILGPRSNVDAFSGAYPGPSGGNGDPIFKRLQIAESDLSPAVGTYFVEGHYVAADDAAAGNASNNASYKRVSVGGGFELVPQGTMFESRPGIFAWLDHGLGVDTPDPSVQVVYADVPNEGRFQVASKVTDLGGGSWRYDYAVRNHNSHLSGGSFEVPIPVGTNATNVGFHDVDYHSGEPYDNTNWTPAVSATSVAWSSPQTFAQNPNSNALRFATMYNFWFDADAPPGNGAVTVGLFRPNPGGPGSVSAAAAVPSSGTGTPAGVVPDGASVPGVPLTAGKNGADLDLAWGSSCNVGDTDYAIYEGDLGDFTSHRIVVCSTSGLTSRTVPPQTPDSYYLVVPLSSDREGSYGADSQGADRATAAAACLPQQGGVCP